MCSCEVSSCSRAAPVRSPVLSVLVFHPVSRCDGAVDGPVKEKKGDGDGKERSHTYIGVR